MRIFLLLCSCAASLGTLYSQVVREVIVPVQLRDTAGRAVTGDVTILSTPALGRGPVRMDTVRTDADGVARIRVDGSRSALLVGRSDDHRSAEREIPVGTELAAPVEIRLSPVSRVSGRVLDDNGIPVPSAAVRVVYPGEKRRFVYENEDGATSDASGAFTLPFVVRGTPFRLAVVREDSLPGFSPPMMAFSDMLEGVVVITRPAPQVVYGTVVDRSGAPITGATVRLAAYADGETYSIEEKETSAFLSASNRLAWTDSAGRFEFRGVPQGRVLLTARRPQGQLTKAESVVGKSQSLQITLVVPD